MTPEEALSLVLNRIQDFAFTEDCCRGIQLTCGDCGTSIYEVEDADYLECMVQKAFDHKCKETK